MNTLITLHRRPRPIDRPSSFWDSPWSGWSRVPNAGSNPHDFMVSSAMWSRDGQPIDPPKDPLARFFAFMRDPHLSVAFDVTCPWTYFERETEHEIAFGYDLSRPGGHTERIVYRGNVTESPIAGEAANEFVRILFPIGDVPNELCKAKHWRWWF